MPSKGREYVPVPVADHRKADLRRAERGKALGGREESREAAGQWASRSQIRSICTRPLAKAQPSYP